jgi:hypothetical protein
VLEVDAWGRPARRPCYNNPDYRNWHLSIIEDYAKSYDLDGIAWCAERPGPLNYLMQAPTPTESVTCFCPHCQAIARERGIDVRRAIEGYRRAIEWNERVAAGNRPADGAFVSFWRLLLQYPGLLAWQTLWIESQRQMYRDIYGLAKACRPSLQVGWHIYHNASFNPFFRADQDYGELSRCSDFVKVVTYNNCAGQRFQGWVDNLCRSLFADASPAEVYPLLLKLLQLDEAPYTELPGAGFSADYVRRETARAVAAVSGRCRIYSGIDVDIPVSPTLYGIFSVGELRARFAARGHVRVIFSNSCSDEPTAFRMKERASEDMLVPDDAHVQFGYDAPGPRYYFPLDQTSDGGVTSFDRASFCQLRDGGIVAWLPDGGQPCPVLTAPDE